MAAGKGHWLEPREDKVFAKGKGEMSTFWLKDTVSNGPASSEELSSVCGDLDMDMQTSGDGFQAAFQTDAAKTMRLVRFNVGKCHGRFFRFG